jgi:alkylhydroperoxidase/carboxymuconolactone decarboxylase family protein YurZ
VFIAVIAAVAVSDRPSDTSRTMRNMSNGQEETPILDLLAKMNEDSIEAADLDPKTLMLVRIAALVAVDAPPASYLLNLKAADDAGLDADLVRGVFAAVAPIVGGPRVAAGIGNVMRALGLAELASEQAALGVDVGDAG